MSQMSADEAEIFALVMRVRAAVAARDIAAIADNYVDAAYTTRWHISQYGGVYARQGWDEVFAQMRQSLSDLAIPTPPGVDQGEIANLNIRVSGDIGWVTFTRSYPEPMPHRAGRDAAHHVRIVERHKGRWRIAFSGFLDPAVGRPELPSLRLKPDATIVWADAAAMTLVEQDLDLSIRAGKLRLRHSEGNAKLVAALRWAASLDRGVIRGRGALPVVLETGHGLPARLWWVIAESGAIYFAFPSEDQHERRLDAAAAVYGLSVAQHTVAGHIVDGLALPEVAAAMGVTASTVRTHLNRIFEKTGVRNQTALVRVLLSSGAPF